MVFALFGCSNPEVISNHYTSKQSGKELLDQFAPQEQIFIGNARIIRSVNGNSYELRGAMTSLMTGDTLEGEITVHLIEYMDKKDMMLAGVPTWGYRATGTQPLSSAGAFTINISVDGEPARPRWLNFFLPSNEPVESMELFYGVSNEESFVWRTTTSGGGAPIGGVMFTSESELGGVGNSGYEGYVWLKNYMQDAGVFNINCDYFFGDNVPRTDILVHPTNTTDLDYETLDMSLLFHSENAALCGFWDFSEEAFRFYNVPLGYDVTCFALSVTTNQQVLLGLLDFETEVSESYNVELNLSSEQELESILESL